MKKKLFIDVDGVILGERNLPARHLDLFLDLVLRRFDCYWLTTHKLNVMKYLGQHLDPVTVQRLQAVSPISFRTLKTEALAGDFIWLDDAPLACEIDWLRERGLLDRWIEVNTRRRPDDLLRAIRLLDC